MAGNVFRQARICLPNWYVKVVRPGKELPENEVMLHVPLKMTKLDVRNYLQSIYNVEVAKVNTRIQLGKTKTVLKRGQPKKMKLPDVKVAYVTLVRNCP
jgi:large subunit ribosomal protein L23